MSQFEINLAMLTKILEGLSTIRKRIGNHLEALGRMQSYVDEAILARRGLRQRLSRAAGRLYDLDQRLFRIEQLLRMAIQKYSEAESTAVDRAEDIKDGKGKSFFDYVEDGFSALTLWLKEQNMLDPLNERIEKIKAENDVIRDLLVEYGGGFITDEEARKLIEKLRGGNGEISETDVEEILGKGKMPDFNHYLDGMAIDDWIGSIYRGIVNQEQLEGLTIREMEFVDQILREWPRDIDIKDIIKILDILHENNGDISRKELEGIIGKTDKHDADLFGLLYRLSMEGLDIVEAEFIFQGEKGSLPIKGFRQGGVKAPGAPRANDKSQTNAIPPKHDLMNEVQGTTENKRKNRDGEELGKTPSQAEGGGQWGNPGEVTNPENAPNPSAQPRGYKTTIRENMDNETKRSLSRENEAAEILSKNGYDVEQNPKISDTHKDPDYLIKGTIFDCYSPKGETSPRAIASQIEKKKIREGQTRRVVLNLGDWDGDINELKKQFNDWPVKNLDEVIVITKDKTIIHLLP
ncbi:hypothetical protein ACFQZE_14095 [Paenibacillus sp. GCM10027627]|uniref:CdiA C-terminal domain-containing protein n=1 Tax=unclassified Paenibacillus TaxID=185978 RepID=UPI0036343F5F